ncbi:MAG: methyltransferase family protein [Candidatus Thorarchaeota archaeon]
MIDLKKIIGVPILILFLNLGFLFFYPEIIFSYPSILTIVLFEGFIILDIVVRPISTEEDQYRRSRMFNSILFLSMPFLMITPIFERDNLSIMYLKLQELTLIAYVGIGILLLGGIILLVSRYYLGQFGGPRIVLERDHQLITRGTYRYIRHPIYLGMILLFIGYIISLAGILVSIVWTFILFIILRERIIQEEELLKLRFGREYDEYVSRTCRLIPFLY